MPISVDLIVACSSWQKAGVPLEYIPTWVIAACKHGAQQLVEGEITVTLADNRTIHDLNQRHRQQDKPTNVLSFPVFSTLEELIQASLHSGQLIGDIILAYETVSLEALRQDKSLSAHTSHLLVHGTLHLLGYDHEEESQAEEMESLEANIMKDLGFENPYTCIL